MHGLNCTALHGMHGTSFLRARKKDHARRKLTAYSTCLCHGLRDGRLACTCRPMKPQELRSIRSSLDPPLNFRQYLRPAPRITSGGGDSWES